MQARLDDLDNKEMAISFKERRFLEEKEFLDSQISALQVSIYAFKRYMNANHLSSENLQSSELNSR